MKCQSGATIVEFSLILLVFLMFFLGILDFARMLWTWNAANEATRWGARTAVLCDRGAPAVLSKMKKFLPQLVDSSVKVEWYVDDVPSLTCGRTNCTAVKVEITSLDYQWISPIIGMSSFSIPMPKFSTYLPREMMWTNTANPTEYAAVCA